ncbi:MAG TPA: DDE-type integrase/transposase/recombinase [Bryobacteraceae bacterium]|nr:DDE-type integrase/transposase/recombinase [Bryobacteraceae bacterium]
MRKKRLGLAGLRSDAAFVMEQLQMSERQACKLVELDRSSYRYEPRPDHNAELRQELVNLARQKPRYGYRRLHALLIRGSFLVSAQRVYRLYRAEGLMVRRLKRKRLSRVPLASHVARSNQEWALDFVSDSLATGRAIRVLAVVDSFTRENLSLEVDTSLSSRRVTRALEVVIERRGIPDSIRCDNGPELTSRHFLSWCEERKIQLILVPAARIHERGAGSPVARSACRWHVGRNARSSPQGTDRESAGDIRCSGYGLVCPDAANVRPGKTALVVGDGAVGLRAVLSAKQMGADSALECVGTQESMMQAIRSTRPGGFVSYVGVPHGVELHGEQLFYAEVHLHGGPAPVRRYLPELIDLVLNEKINPGRVFDLMLPLNQVAEGYRAMDERRAIKTLLRP